MAKSEYAQKLREEMKKNRARQKIRREAMILVLEKPEIALEVHRIMSNKKEWDKSR